MQIVSCKTVKSLYGIYIYKKQQNTEKQTKTEKQGKGECTDQDLKQIVRQAAVKTFLNFENFDEFGN